MQVLDKKINNGFTLIETLVYVAILSILSTVIVVITTSMLRTFSNLEAYEDITHSSTVALERITREIRKAESIDLDGSVLSIHPGVLILHTRNEGGMPTTITINLTDGKIMLQEGLLSPAPLTSERITISNLVFTRIPGANTEAVRIGLTAERSSQGTVVSKDFQTFIVLDES
jgi:prepilin-type N-terminal cleavage/methylation domain-containing protein